MLYKCPKCKKIHDTNEWNESTIKEFSEKIVRIDECETGFYFVCPLCHRWIRRIEIIEIKNKRDMVKNSLLRLAN